jgi:hypothetical protein
MDVGKAVAASRLLVRAGSLSEHHLYYDAACEKRRARALAAPRPEHGCLAAGRPDVLHIAVSNDIGRGGS